MATPTPRFGGGFGASPAGVLPQMPGDAPLMGQTGKSRKPPSIIQKVLPQAFGAGMQIGQQQAQQNAMAQEQQMAMMKEKLQQAELGADQMATTITKLIQAAPQRTPQLDRAVKGLSDQSNMLAQAVEMVDPPTADRIRQKITFASQAKTQSEMATEKALAEQQQGAQPQQAGMVQPMAMPEAQPQPQAQAQPAALPGPMGAGITPPSPLVQQAQAAGQDPFAAAPAEEADPFAAPAAPQGETQLSEIPGELGTKMANINMALEGLHRPVLKSDPNSPSIFSLLETPESWPDEWKLAWYAPVVGVGGSMEAPQLMGSEAFNIYNAQYRMVRALFYGVTGATFTDQEWQSTWPRWMITPLDSNDTAADKLAATERFASLAMWYNLSGRGLNKSPEQINQDARDMALKAETDAPLPEGFGGSVRKVTPQSILRLQEIAKTGTPEQLEDAKRQWQEHYNLPAEPFLGM